MTTPVEKIIPYGYCHCGCGDKTNPSGRRLGIPSKYIRGHHGRIRPELECAVPFKIDGVYCRVIKLTKGFFTIVEESDYKFLMQWKWFASTSKKRNAVYAVRNSEEKDGVKHHIKMHRHIMGLAYGDDREVDHENCNGIDNRRDNLRIVSHMENRWNVGKFRNNTSGYKGVSWCHWKEKWVARIGVDGKYIRLGYSDDPEEAYKLVCDAAIKYHQQFARVV